jgi:hypothetical protein
MARLYRILRYMFAYVSRTGWGDSSVREATGNIRM